jgi:REP element-mobilizing transposase RayT
LDAADKTSFTLLAYVLMPDHLHVLLKGSAESNLSSLTKRFKQETGFWFKAKSKGQQLWQKSYHDHVLRREEDLHEVALYIAANPVRAALAADWEGYPHWGGSLLRRAAVGDLKVAATSAPRPSESGR